MRRVSNRGVALVYASVAIVVLMGFVSFAVDFGRVQAAKTELQNATDAAARYAVTGISDSSTLSRAQSVASANKVDGSALVLTAADVELGNWNSTTRVFTLSGSPSNAVRVTGRRTTARGTAVPLLFGRAFGRNTCDITAVSITSQNVTPVGVVGINSLSISGSGLIRRATGETGSMAAASNGTYSFSSGSNTITGDAYYRTAVPSGTVTGTKIPLSSNFTYAAPTAPGTYTARIVGNAEIVTPGTFSGVYVVTGNWNCTSTLTLGGDLDVYVGGTVNFASTFRIISNGNQLRVFVTGTGAVTVSCTNNIEVLFYAPRSAVTYTSGATKKGSVVALTLSIQSPTEYSSNYPIPFTPGGGGSQMTAAGGVTRVQ